MEQRAASAGHAATDEPSRIVVLDAHSDHAILIAESLERAFPRAEISSAESVSGAPAQVDVAVVSLALDAESVITWLEELGQRGRAPGVVFVAGKDDRWPKGSRERVPHAAQLEKNAGARFLHRLPDAVRRARPALEAPKPKPEPAAEPKVPAPGTALFEIDDQGRILAASEGVAALLALPPAELEAGREIASVVGTIWSELQPGRWVPCHRLGGLHLRLVPLTPERRLLLVAKGSEDAQEHPEAVGGGRNQPAVLASLAGELAERLSHAEPVVELLARRGAGDAVLQRYADGLRDELRRAVAIAGRLAAIGGRGRGERGRLPFSPGALLRLRLGAWRRLGPPEVDFVLDEGDGGGVVPVDLAVLGTALDTLVLGLARAVSPRGELRCTISRVHFSAIELARRPGASAGLSSRVSVRAKPSALAHGPMALPPRFVDLGIAAAKAHGGYLEWVEADDERGFDMLLPSVSTWRVPTGPSRSVLVVDDEEPVRRLLAEMLAATGYEVKTAQRGADAVALLQAGCRYDVVLLDLAMPGLDGEATFRAMQEIDPGVRVVLCTGSPTPDAVRRMLARGLLGLIVKPFRMTELVEMVRASVTPAPEPTGARPTERPSLETH